MVYIRKIYQTKYIKFFIHFKHLKYEEDFYFDDGSNDELCKR